MLAKLHLAEDAFALHLPLQRLERLIDIVVSNENLHAQLLCSLRIFFLFLCRELLQSEFAGLTGFLPRCKLNA